MELEGFVKPVSDFYHSILIKESNLGMNITAFDFNESYDWSSFRIALIGLPFSFFKEESEEYLVAYEIRRNLALLAKPLNKCKIIDLGNIIRGRTPKDTAFAIGEVVAQLHRENIVTILLGSTTDLGLGNFLGFASNKKAASLIHIDSHINLLYEGERLSDRLTLDEIIFRDSEYLFNYTNIGYQSYYVSQKEIDLLDDLYFDAYRLGVVRSNLKEYEPVLRDAEIVNLSLNAVKYSDSPGSLIKSPNGFTGEEACQLSFYTGLSSKVMSFGVYDIGLDENRAVSCILAAQIIWYFIEGVLNQIGESPRLNNADFTRFAVNVNQLSQEFVFYRSNKSGRWWVEVPVKPEDKIIISCSPLDYEKAVAQEIPERWWKMFQKLN
ncbi:MAG TPA: arginase family protein [Bacteroidales bacterium]|nr:arginase family protein [Bacteroidales bacterium]